MNLFPFLNGFKLQPPNFFFLIIFDFMKIAKSTLSILFIQGITLLPSANTNYFLYWKLEISGGSQRLGGDESQNYVQLFVAWVKTGKIFVSFQLTFLFVIP